MARTIVTDSEMAALIKRQQQLQQQQQQQQQQQKNAGGAAGTVGQQQTTVQIGTTSSAAGITTAQLLAQAGLQVSLILHLIFFKENSGFLTIRVTPLSLAFVYSLFNFIFLHFRTVFEDILD